METWPNDLLESVKEIMWSQWSALGAYLTVEPARRSVVDPEALLVATSAFGRRDARLFDEAMDWLSVNNRVLKPWRLKRIARTFGPEVQRTLGAVLEYVSQVKEEDLFYGVRREARDSLEKDRGKDVLKPDTKEELFWLERGSYSNKKKTSDPVFRSWGLLRGTPRIRGHSGRPDQENPANIMIRLRGYYGTGTRADVMTYLLTAGGGSSNEIASKLKYNQKGVYDALEEMSETGLVYKYGGVKRAHYWVDRPEMTRSLGLEEELPAFFVWGDIYDALYLVVSDYAQHEDDYADEFLSAERMLNLTVKVVPLLRNAGGALSQLPVPNTKRQSGSQHMDKLIEYLQEVVGVLGELTFG